jgi:hypothetical protein
MKLLTATHELQGQGAGDFCYTIEGELVLLGFVCATDEKDPDGGCGCGRAFSGMSSMRATTTAMVRDVNVSFDDALLAVRGYWTSYGLRPEDFASGEEFAEFVADTAAGMAEIAAALPVGSVVGRRLDELIVRSQPGGVSEH